MNVNKTTVDKKLNKGAVCLCNYKKPYDLQQKR